LAIQDEYSLLMFSGGETRARTGPETEGGSVSLYMCSYMCVHIL